MYFGRRQSKRTLEEIKELLKKKKKEKRQIVFKKGLYGAATAGITLTSFLAPIAAFSGLAASWGCSPFKKDEVKQIAHIKTEFSSDEGREVTKQYSQFEDDKSLLHYYEGWKSDGVQFVSSESTYDIEGLTYDEVISHIKPDGTITLGEPISTRTIYKDEVQEESRPSYKGVIYDKDEDDYIMVIQSDEENSKEISACILCGSVIGVPLGIMAFTVSTSKFNFDGLEWREAFVDCDLKDLKKQKKEKKKLVKKLK